MFHVAVRTMIIDQEIEREKDKIIKYSKLKFNLILL